jgi:hypothetical protein
VVRKNFYVLLAFTYWWPSPNKRSDIGCGAGQPNEYLHLILQTLQCNTDVGIITYNRKESQEYPVPDFSYNMMCRDFDGLRKWQDEAMMPVETIEVDEASLGEGGPGLAEVGGVDEGGSEAEGEGDERDDDG